MYHFTADETTQSFENLADANEAAALLKLELEVIHTESGIVATVHTPVHGRHFHPYERVETPKHPAPAIPGFIPAYTRKRITATAYRGIATGSGWAVHDGRTGNVRYTKDTTETRHLFTSMRLGEML